MSKLNAWLEKNADVVASMEEFSDGETTLKVHVASEPSVEQDLAEVAEAELRQCEIKRDCDVLVEGQVAMEAYAALLQEAQENGGISAQTASFMRIGMEQYESAFGLETSVVPSTEAFGGTSSRQAATDISLEGFKEVLSKGWEALKRALAALLAAVKDVYTKATNGAARLEKRAQDLSKAAKGTRGSKTQDTVKISAAQRLSIGDKWLGDDVPLMIGFIKAALEGYPKAVIDYAGQIATAIGSYDPAKGDLDALISGKVFKLDGIISSINGTKSTDPRFGDVDLVRSEVVLGERALYVAMPKSTGDAVKDLGAVARAMRAEFLATGTEQKTTEREIEVASTDQLSTTASQVALAAKRLQTLSVSTKDIDACISKLIKAGDDLKGKLGEAELTAAQQREGEALLRTTAAMQHMLGGVVTGIMSYCVSTLNAQLVVVERQLAVYESREVTVA